MSSYFAPSSRFGPPEELRRLIEAAQKLGLQVLLELVHSFFASRTQDPSPPPFLQVQLELELPIPIACPTQQEMIDAARDSASH